MQAAKEISELELQKEFILNINGKQVGIYIADFHYFDETEKKYVISDAKGIETDVFKIKWKIMKALYSGYIFEIRKQTKVIRS